MIGNEQARTLGDIVVAPGIGTAGLLAQSSDLAGQLTPVLTVVMISLTILWYAWRMIDRWRFGPSHKRGDDE